MYTLSNIPTNLTSWNERVCAAERTKADRTQILVSKEGIEDVIVFYEKDGQKDVHVLYNMVTSVRYNAMEKEGGICIAVPAGIPGVTRHYSEHADMLDAAVYVKTHVLSAGPDPS